MELTNITQELYEGAQRLQETTDKLFELARKAAEKDKDYTIALAKEKLKLKEQGMAIGLIDDIAKGNLADLRFERDLAKEEYLATKEAIKSIQSQLSALQSILKLQTEV